jgi:hypothetical protein
MVITAALIEPALPGAKCIVTDHREFEKNSNQILTFPISLPDAAIFGWQPFLNRNSKQGK